MARYAHTASQPQQVPASGLRQEKEGAQQVTPVPLRGWPHPVRIPWGLAEAAELTPQVHTWERGLQGCVFWFFFEGWVRKRRGGFSWRGSRSSLAT